MGERKAADEPGFVDELSDPLTALPRYFGQADYDPRSLRRAQERRQRTAVECIEAGAPPPPAEQHQRERDDREALPAGRERGEQRRPDGEPGQARRVQAGEIRRRDAGAERPQQEV